MPSRTQAVEHRAVIGSPPTPFGPAIAILGTGEPLNRIARLTVTRPARLGMLHGLGC